MDVTQEDIDALATQVDDLHTQLQAGISAVQGEVDELERQIQSGTASNNLDLAPLKTSVANLGTDVEGVKNIKPTPSTPGTAASEQPPTNPDGTAAENTTDPPGASQSQA